MVCAADRQASRRCRIGNFPALLFDPTDHQEPLAIARASSWAGDDSEAGTEFAADSSLEGDGFEPPVPPGKSVGFSRRREGREANRMVAEASISFEGDQQCESRLLRHCR